MGSDADTASSCKPVMACIGRSACAAAHTPLASYWLDHPAYSYSLAQTLHLSLPCLQQVKEWIEAWRGSAATDAEPAPAAPVEVPSGAPTTRVTEPTLPPSAAAVLSAMTADAPVANTPMDAAPAAAIEGQQQQEERREELEPVLAAVAAPAAPADTEPSAAEKEVAYKAKVAAVVRRAIGCGGTKGVFLLAERRCCSSGYVACWLPAQSTNTCLLMH